MTRAESTSGMARPDIINPSLSHSVLFEFDWSTSPSSFMTLVLELPEVDFFVLLRNNRSYLEYLEIIL